MPWGDARDKCAALGMRLCGKGELERGESAGTGCGRDGRTPVQDFLQSNFHALGLKSGGHRPAQDPQQLLRSDLSAFCI